MLPGPDASQSELIPPVVRIDHFALELGRQDVILVATWDDRGFLYVQLNPGPSTLHQISKSVASDQSETKDLADHWLLRGLDLDAGLLVVTKPAS